MCLQSGFYFIFQLVGVVVQFDGSWKGFIFDEFVKLFICQVGQLSDKCYVDYLVIYQ